MLNDYSEVFGGLYADPEEVSSQIFRYADSCVKGCCTENGRFLQGNARIKFVRNGSKRIITIEIEAK